MITQPSVAPDALCILGAVGTGKTEHLIMRATTLLDKGASPQTILVLCATPSAADAFRVRLEAAVGNRAAGVTIETARYQALSILSCEKAITTTERSPRMLADFEINFLLEDLKVSGLRPKRLKEMLKFFYRTWTELNDDDPSWLMASEEQEIHALIKQNLHFYQAMIEPEIANIAVNYLLQDTAALASNRFTHVLVDDYQNISRASQILASLLAADSITIAGNENECLEMFDSYPFAAGLTEFVDTNPHAKTQILNESQLAAAVTNATNKIAAENAFTTLACAAAEASQGTLAIDGFGAIEDEFKGVAAFVSSSIKEGTIPANIIVTVPNKVWARHATAYLENEGIKTDLLPLSQPLAGDIRDNECSVALRIYTALALVANPRDACAWRCWCGFGDYLTNSTAMNALRTLANERSIGMLAALQAITEDPRIGFNGAEKLVSAYQSGRALIDECQHKTGSELLSTINQAVTKGAAVIPAVLRTLCGPEENDDATTLIERARKRLLFPRFSGDATAIKVAAPAQTCGLTCEVLAYTGCVNGFIPNRDYFDSTKITPEKQERMRAYNMRLLYSTLGKARAEVHFTYFTKADLESAELLKLKIDRIRLEKGERICTLSPSEYLGIIS